MPPIFINGQEVVKRYVGILEVVAAYVGSRQVFGGEFDPLSLFASGEQGAWYDPSDLSTMFQDAAGTTPVTADGQPVGKILDKSGRGNHASQATAAARPLYKTDGTYHWLQFDGVDDRLSTAATNFTSTDKMSVFNGVKVSGTTNQGFYAVGTGGNGRCDGTFLAGASPVNRASILGVTGGIAQVSTPAAGAAPKSYVISHLYDIAGASATDEIKNRQNGALWTQTVVAAGPAGGGNFSTGIIVIGDMSLGAAPLKGNIYSIIIRGALSTTQEITDTETWVNNKTGAF